MVTHKFIPFSGDDIEKNSKGSSWYMFFCCIVADLLLITYGCLTVWPSPVIRRLVSNNTDINPLGAPISTIEVSLIVSLPSASSTISLFFISKVMDKLGRKKTMLYVSMAMVLFLTTLSFSASIYVYYISLFAVGLTQTGALTSVACYVSEIADDENRGKAGCSIGLSFSTGILLGYIFGSITSVRLFTLICALPALLHILFSCLITESPIFLDMNGHKIETIEVLEKLRGSTNFKVINTEYKKLEELNKATVGCKQRDFRDLFKDRVARKALTLTIQMNGFQQCSGILVILAFVASIFEVFADISGDTVGILVGVVTVCVYLLTVILVDKLGRRFLLMTSSIICSIAMFLLGLYMYLKQIDSPIIQNIRWLPVFAVILYIFGYGLGLGPIPIAASAELFPNDLRSVGMATTFFVGTCIMSSLVFIYPILSEAVGSYICMWMFSATTLVACICFWINIPETKGKSFLEIQEMLSR